jgi:antiviral helicase SLH1
MAGLFYFGEAFRPVPLEKHFIGVKGKPGSTTSTTNLDRTTYEKVISLLKDGHQVMVFVHARRETMGTARKLHEMAMLEGTADYFDCSVQKGWDTARVDVGRSKNKELREFFDYGLGVHHAGMLRGDRNLAERLFAEGWIKVLCCTATLAWGVNLPAYAVIIKGTELYDQTKGKFVDLGVLDVLQVHHPPSLQKEIVDGDRFSVVQDVHSMNRRGWDIFVPRQTSCSITSPP